MILPPLLRLLEDNCTVTPAGIPLAASTALELNPFPGVMVIIVAADVPGPAEMLAGDAFTVNVVGEDTVSMNVVELETLPLVP